MLFQIDEFFANRSHKSTVVGHPMKHLSRTKRLLEIEVRSRERWERHQRKNFFFTVRVDRSANCCLPAWSKENGHATDFRALARIQIARDAQCTHPKTPEPEAHCCDTPL